MPTISKREPRIAYLIKWVERGLRVHLDVALSACGVTTPEYTALSVLRERDGLSSAQLARRVFVTPQAMNLIVLELERRGFVRRRQSDVQARAMHVNLTRKGLACLERCDLATLPVEERFLASLSKAEAVTLRRALSVCADALFDGESKSARSRSDLVESRKRNADIHGE